jgi:hypothetical protein
MAFEFLRSLPEAGYVGAFEKSPGINIDGAFIGNALVNILFGEKVPAKTYTIGVNGRGSLVMEEQEFRDLLASMIKTFESQKLGFVPPAQTAE